VGLTVTRGPAVGVLVSKQLVGTLPESGRISQQGVGLHAAGAGESWSGERRAVRHGMAVVDVFREADVAVVHIAPSPRRHCLLISAA
jgi:hypothetical protein